MALQTGKNGEMQFVLRVKDDGTPVIEKFADTTDKSAKKSSKAMDDFGRGAGISLNSVSMYAGIAAAAVVATGASMVKASIDSADAAAKMSRTLGTTTEALTALQYHAGLAGIANEELSSAMLMMKRNVDDAARGTGLAVDAIHSLGLSAAALAKMKPEDAIMAIADAIERIPDPNKRATISMDLFGRGMAKMTNLMQGGSAAIRAGMSEAERFNQTISGAAAKAAEEYNDNLSRLQANFTGMANVIMEAVVPSLVKFTDLLLGKESIEAMEKQRAGLLALKEAQSGFVAGLAGVDIAKIDDELAALDKRIEDARSNMDVTKASADITAAYINSQRASTDAAEAADRQTKFMERYAELSRALASERQLEHDSDIERQALLDEAWMRDASTTAMMYAEREEQARQHAEKMVEISKREAEKAQRERDKMWQFSLNQASSFFGNLSSLMRSESKKQFEIGKTAAIAQAVIDTIASAQGAFRALASIPFVGPGLAAAAAAAAIVAGTIRVNQIKAQQFGGTGSAAPGGGAIPTYNANPNTGQPNYALPPPPDLGVATPRTVNISILSDNGMVSTEWVRNQFAPTFLTAIGDGAVNLNFV